MERIGIDIGKVIIGPLVDGRDDTSFLGRRVEEAVHTPPADGCVEVVRALVERTGGSVWLVSKCGPSVQRKTLAWLAHQRFHERTGLDPGHVRFCLERRDKALHARELGLTSFVDDRLDVLEHLRGLVGQLVWFGEQRGFAPDWVQPARDWPAVAQRLGLPAV